jgi:hypothetical protein
MHVRAALLFFEDCAEYWLGSVELVPCIMLAPEDEEMFHTLVHRCVLSAPQRQAKPTAFIIGAYFTGDCSPRGETLKQGFAWRAYRRDAKELVKKASA